MPELKNESLYKYLLMLGDNSMILGHRLSELCGHGPTLETDIALTNISLDLFGQVRNIFQYAAKIKGEEATEDSIAYLRNERQHLNCILVEQPNKDFAHVIVRQFLFDAFQKLQLEALEKSNDSQIAAIATKSLKETKYHLRFSSEWCKRLGAGTDISHQKMQDALNELYPFVHEFFVETSLEKEMADQGIGINIKAIEETYFSVINEILAEATLQIPDTPGRHTNGKTGVHSEHLGYILSDFQYMQRSFPNMQW